MRLSKRAVELPIRENCSITTEAIPENDIVKVKAHFVALSVASTDSNGLQVPVVFSVT